MNSHNPFNTGGSGCPSDFRSGDQLVDRIIGDAYHVVKEVYLALGNLTYIYNYLQKYGLIITVDSEEAIKDIPLSIGKFARVYNKSDAAGYYFTDYLYVDDDATGIRPNDPNATGSWISTKSTGSNASFVRIWKYRAVADGETTIQLPTDMPIVGVQTIYVQGMRQDVGEGFIYNEGDATLTLADELEAGNLVTVIIGITDPDMDIDIFAILKGTNGASNIGTSTGDTVEERLATLDSEVDPTLRSNLGSDDGLKLIGQCPDIETLRNTEPTTNNQRISVRSYYSGGNYGGGEFYYDANDITSSDDGGSVIVTNGGMRWKRIVTNSTYMYEDFGVKFDGVADDTVAIQRANNMTLLGHTIRAITPNGRARITSQVIFYAGSGKTDMGTSYLKPDRLQMTTGYAARVMGDINKVYNLGSSLTINMIGPYGEVSEKPPTDTDSITTNLCGLDINPGDNTQVSNVDFWIKVFGFKSNVRIGPKSVYLLRFFAPNVGKSWQYNWIFDCQNDAGENISFIGGCGFNAQNSTRTACDIYVTPEGQYLGLYLDCYSQDYCDIEILQKGGHITKKGGQFEDNSLSPYVIMEYQSGKRKPALFLTDVNIDGGNDAAQDAGNTGKPSWFKVGNTCIFRAKGGTWGKYAKMQNIKLIDAAAGGPVAASIEGVFFDVASNIDSLEWGAHGNPLRNYDFNLNNMTGWKVDTIYTGSATATVPTVSYDGSSPVGKAIKLSSLYATGETTTLVGQKIPVTPGNILYMSALLSWQNVAGANGSAYFGYVFYDANGEEISHANMGTPITTGNSASTLKSGSVRVPNGAVYAHVGLRHYQLSGDIWLGKVNAFCQ